LTPFDPELGDLLEEPAPWEPRPLSLDWRGLVELERRLLEPWVQQAARYEVGLVYTPEGPLDTLRIQVWTSVLAPIYLQLFEGLRLATERHLGAAFCRECGLPFLTLDARRAVFCTERERNRYAQRLMRRRQAAKAAGSTGDDAEAETQAT
jgi:hypothetical protein